MTKRVAKAFLRDIKSDYEHPTYKEAVTIAIQALTDPEWIPNTGTKPECEWAWVRFGSGSILASNGAWNWSTDLDIASRITHYIPIPDPPEFKEKRRYVVKPSGATWFVRDEADKACVACHIETAKPPKPSQTFTKE